MATSLEQFSILQFGKESTKGTLVAATKQLIARGVYTDDRMYYRPNYPRNVLANVGGAGSIVGGGSMLEVEMDLSAEQMLPFLLSGIRGNVTPTAGGTGDQTWVFTPQLTTAVRTLDAFTWEVIRGDGTTNHFYREFGYGLCSGYQIDWAYNQIAKAKASVFGRLGQTGTATGSLSPYSTQEELVSNLLKVYIDDDWASLGGTQLTAIVRSASLKVSTGLAPNVTLDGRTDLDMTGYKVGPFTSTLDLNMEFDSVAAAAAFTKARSNSVQFVRLINTGGVIGAAVKTVKVDGAYRFVSMPADPGADGNELIVPIRLESVYDPTSAKTFETTLINGLASA